MYISENTEKVLKRFLEAVHELDALKSSSLDEDRIKLTVYGGKNAILLQISHDDKNNHQPDAYKMLQSWLDREVAKIKASTPPILDKWPEEYALKIAALGHDDAALNACIAAQARFPGVSLSHALLILKQYPDAREVRTAERWKDNGYAVRNAEKGIVVPSEEGSSEKYQVVYDLLQTTKPASPEIGAFASTHCKIICANLHKKIAFKAPGCTMVTPLMFSPDRTTCVYDGAVSEIVLLSETIKMCVHAIRKAQDQGYKETDNQNQNIACLVASMYGVRYRFAIDFKERLNAFLEPLHLENKEEVFRIAANIYKEVSVRTDFALGQES